MVAAFAAEVAALLGPRRADAQDFEALEQALRRRALGLAAQALAQYFNADDADHSDSTVACACGGKARYAGRRPKTFTTLLGPLTLERAYYHCDACRTGVCPRDRALGLHATSLSPGVLRMVGLAASDFSFAAASDLLWELAAVRVETKQVERAAEALGREVAADERAVAETVPSPAPTMYLGLDGSGVPVRPTEVEGRRGKQPDGSAKTREVKLATVWTAETRDKAGRPVRDRGSVSYNAAVESAASRDTDPQPAAFAQRAYREAIRRGFDSAAQRVVIGDGAAWIWNLAAEHFPGAIEIVDIYHAKQHLCDVAKAIYGPGTDLADRWASDRRAELDAGRLWCARLTGEGQPVEVRRKEGVTNHFRPESCAGRCEAAGEALTGARTGRAIEHRKRERLERRDCHSGRRQHRHHRNGEGMAGSTVSENPCTFVRPSSGPGRSSFCPGSRTGAAAGRRIPYPMMHGMKKSDEAIVPVKAANKGAQTPAECRREGLNQGESETKARTGRRAGTACHRRLSGYGKLRRHAVCVNHPR